MIQNTLVKFHKLPPEIKQAVTSPAGLQAIQKLEEEHHVSLADTLIRVLVKEIKWEELPSVLVAEHGVKPGSATEIVNVLETNILQGVLPYLRQSQAAQSVPVQTANSVPAPKPAQLSKIPEAPQAPKARAQQLVAARMPKPKQTPASGAARFQQMKAGNAAFYVYAEDEHDIARHRDRLSRIAGASPTAELNTFVDQLIASQGLQFADEVLEKRFRSIVVSRLRDVRNSEETKDLLTRAEKVGGMEYDEAAAASIMAALEERVQYIHNQSSAQGVSSHDDLPQTQTQPMPEAEIPLAEAPSVDAAPQATTPAPQPVPPPPPKPQPVRKATVLTESRRPVIRDIQYPNKPMGLADELSVITPDEFRSMGRDLAESVQKILQKIEILAEDSFDKRTQGIAAWRRSPVYLLYLSIGKESMVGGRPVEEVMASLQAEGKPFLTIDEFAAIADLNKQLIT